MADRRRLPTIRYRCPTDQGGPLPGHIIMEDGPRIRRAYLVLGSKKTVGTPALECTTWLLTVEPMSAAAGQSEVAAGCPRWGIVWDQRKKGAQRNA